MKIPELLSPAGTPETAMAAFDGGADAVYCGLGRFNARERAGKFTADSLGRVIEFARRNGKKVYLAVNTLVREPELPGVMELLDTASRLGPDALILQDPGTLLLARRYCPELRLHASTQMGIHNSAGLAVAAELGFRRVILERQVTLEELGRMMKTAPLEVEVFIFGSLCCSLSGRCLLSAFTDGESGNRGRCKQPCRRRWNGKFLLSPADLNAMEILSELRRLGVASLKIEGRLRPPEYVWKTARAFRLLLDGPEDPEPERLEEARQLLNSASGRGSSLGFYFPRSMAGLIDPDRPGTFGTPAAEVCGVKSGTLTVRSVSRLHLGDRLRVVSPNGGDGETFSLIRLWMGDRSVLAVPPGKVCRLAFDGKVRAGDRLFKIGENGFDFSRRLQNLPEPALPADLEIAASMKFLSVRGTVCGKSFEWQTATDFAPPRTCREAGSGIRAAFATGCPAPWRIGRVGVKVDGDFFVPASVWKTLRREFWEQAAAVLPREAPGGGGALLRFFRDYAGWKAAASDLPPVPEYRLPSFCSELDLTDESARVRKAYEGGIRRFRVTSWYGFRLLRDLKDIEIVTAFPLPADNSAAGCLLKSLGVLAAAADPELTVEELAALRAKACIRIEDPEAAPVLATRLALAPGVWAGARGRLRVEFCEREKLFFVHVEKD